MPKNILIAFLAVAIAVAAGLFWLRGGLDGLVRDGIAHYGGAMTRAEVKVGGVDIRAGDGAGFIRDLSIGNPPGFRTPHALKVGEIEIALDVASLAGDVVVIRRILVKAPDVIYEKGETATNFDAIQKNIADYLGPDRKTEPGRKLIVEEFAIRGAKAQASAAFMKGKAVAVPLPDIVLRDLGKAKGGIPPGELGREIAQALKQRLSSAVSFEGLAKSAGQSLDKAGDAIKGLLR
ncbi:MAG: hypothetical protein OHM77_01755 [Candidatus Nitricoxidivorans perseverans]|uniref:AsmA family protein n=1 Tax=Candidatus Nitricoxidivorans perseverans TaxID=2975601 RepID=A0AA49IYH3_9PROT|nr:MAG: hypothetical protein OHM77_01755 [Candidatus Nitricoxidivorans perseverans]